ncbi:MAG: DUF6273 domain-containing protein [Oscillospiraceae bacterium]|jgi:hypothetical protein|nr:DUF6273 domain-containing protein [Oscillospiraceae bacterium]
MILTQQAEKGAWVFMDNYEVGTDFMGRKTIKPPDSPALTETEPGSNKYVDTGIFSNSREITLEKTKDGHEIYIDTFHKGESIDIQYTQPFFSKPEIKSITQNGKIYQPKPQGFFDKTQKFTYSPPPSSEPPPTPHIPYTPPSYPRYDRDYDPPEQLSYSPAPSAGGSYASSYSYSAGSGVWKIVVSVVAVLAVLGAGIGIGNHMAGKKREVLYFGGLEWLVLEDLSDRMLIITKDVVEMRAFNNEPGEVGWEDSDLRGELPFLELWDSFTETDVRRILPRGDDALFLLSQDEVQRYFKTKKLRIARYRGQAVYWWLREPRYSGGYAAMVKPDGSAQCYGKVEHTECGVRPALWLLKSDPGETGGDPRASAPVSPPAQTSAAPPRPAEQEPNGAPPQANHLDADVPLTGRLSDDSDQDWFEFTVPSGQIAFLTLDTPIQTESAFTWDIQFYLGAPIDAMNAGNSVGAALQQGIADALGEDLFADALVWTERVPGDQGSTVLEDIPAGHYYCKLLAADRYAADDYSLLLTVIAPDTPGP